MARRTVADQLVAQIVAAGARHVYGIVGDSLNPVVDAVRRGEWDGSGAGSATRADENASALATEARLVTEARTALVRGEPERALALARSTHRLAARALEPEELALEARALRALGRTDEALATELTLRRRFPSHTLSR